LKYARCNGSHGVLNERLPRISPLCDDTAIKLFDGDAVGGEVCCNVTGILRGAGSCGWAFDAPQLAPAHDRRLDAGEFAPVLKPTVGVQHRAQQVGHLGLR
jgi:hypothetical protein